MAIAGLSSLGIKFGYGTSTYSSGTETKPSTYTQLHRINSIGGLSIDYEKIDVSALEDAIKRYVAGAGDTGGSIEVVVNLTSETLTAWEGVATAYSGLTTGQRMFFQVLHPSLSKAFFFVAIPPTVIPMPESNQNENWTITMQLTVEEYVGLDTKVEMS